MKRTVMFSAMFLMFTVGAFAVDVKTDFDHSVNFSKYQTFAWKTPKASNGIVNNSIVTARIETAVDEKLAQKGIRENDNNPDLYLVTHVGAKNMTDIDYLPPVGGWRHWGWMRGDTVVNRYVEG